MKIWIFHNYSMLPEHGQLNRAYYYGKYLSKANQEPVVFVGSHPHNSQLQLINGNAKYKIYQKTPFPWVLVKTCNYEGSRLKRLISMVQFYYNAKRASKCFEKPDVILGSSAHPLAALLAIRLSKKYKCQSIVEVRDLWPESIVAYNEGRSESLVIRALYRFEKYLYTHADKVVFTMEGAYDYIVERHWENEIPKSKVFFLNNGVDIDAFEYNKENHKVDDPDLTDNSIFKVVYVGSIRKVNNLGLLLNVAKCVKIPEIKFLIYGDGNERKMLEKRTYDEGISNVVFKGMTNKENIPYITSCANLNLAHNSPSKLFRFGISFNKLFDYFAAGKPVLSDFPSKYNPAITFGAGTEVNEPTPDNIAKEIERYASMDDKQYQEFCQHAKEAAEHYRFENLAKIFIEIAKKG